MLHLCVNVDERGKASNDSHNSDPTNLLFPNKCLVSFVRLFCFSVRHARGRARTVDSCTATHSLKTLKPRIKPKTRPNLLTMTAAPSLQKGGRDTSIRDVKIYHTIKFPSIALGQFSLLFFLS